MTVYGCVLCRRRVCVAGDCHKCTEAEYRADLSCKKEGCLSTWGIGKAQPDPAGAVTTETGMVIPCGPLVTDAALKTCAFC
jgi:hypothetical protein